MIAGDWAQTGPLEIEHLVLRFKYERPGKTGALQ